MANETGAAAFARDLGYLDKFFANLTAHADTLPPAQGARLKQLMGEEVVRWKEIRQLIAGQGGSAAPTQNPVATTTAPAPKGHQQVPEGSEPLRVPLPVPAPSPTVSAPASGNDSEKVRVNFTVGSLLGQPKK